MPTTRAGRWGWHSRAALVVATVAVVGLHLLAARSAGPTIINDEAGYLGNARWMAGQDPVFAMPVSPYYSWGYSAVVAPLHWITRDPGLRWQLILVVNAVLLASLVPLLHRVGRVVLGAAPRAALVGAVVGALSPGVLGTGGQAVAEDLSLPLVVVTVLTLHAALASRRPWARLAFGPTVALLYASHPRFTPVVALVGLGLVVALVVRLLPRVVAGANLVGLISGVILVRIVDRLLVEARWPDVATLEGGWDELVAQLTTAEGIRALGRSTLGQGWYLAVGTLGMAVVGGWGLVRIASGRRLVRGDGPQPTTAARVTALGTMLMALGVFAASVYFFSRNDTRDDHLIYGRHNESFIPIWVTSGVALLLSEPVRARLARTLVAVGASIAVVCGAVIATLNPVTHGGVYALRPIAALSRVLEGDPDGVFVRGSVVALVGLAAVAGLAVLIRRPTVAVAVLTVWFGWVALSRVEQTDRSADEAYRGWDVPQRLDRLGVERAAIDVRAAPVAVVTYQFGRPEVRFVPYVPGRDRRPDVPFVVGSSTDPDLARAGARLALVDEAMPTPDGVPALGVWVLPGPELDRLDAAGHLLPE